MYCSRLTNMWAYLDGTLPPFSGVFVLFVIVSIYNMFTHTHTRTHTNRERERERERDRERESKQTNKHVHFCILMYTCYLIDLQESDFTAEHVFSFCFLSCTLLWASPSSPVIVHMLELFNRSSWKNVSVCPCVWDWWKSKLSGRSGGVFFFLSRVSVIIF